MILDNTDWLSSIPKHWEIKRLKDVSSLNPSYDGADLEGDVSFVPMEALRYDDIQRQTIPFDEAKGSYTFFGDGDVLVAKVTPCFENGNIAVATDLVQGVGFGSSEIFTVRANTGICSRFLFYFMRTADFMDKACSTMCGVGGLKRISPEFMRSASVVVPPINEQEKIVSYLDEKIAAINATIAARNEELKLLKKFKQSKIAEVVTHGLTPNVPTKSSPLGQIPAHWEVRRTKDVCTSIFTGATPSTTVEEFWDGDIPWIPSGCCHDCFITEAPKYITQAGLENSSTRWIPAGTTVMAITGATCAQLGTLKIDACANQSVVAFMEEKIKLNARYLFYILFALRDSILANRTGGAQAGIDTGDCMNILICLPPHEEQIEIVSYLNDECDKIDEKCRLIDEQIKKMQLLKRALINEVVTGKRQLA